MAMGNDMKPYLDYLKSVEVNMQLDKYNGMTEEEGKIKYAAILEAADEIERISKYGVGRNRLRKIK